MKKIAALLIITGCIVMISCKKKIDHELSHEKEIKTFGVKVVNSGYVGGIIRNDSILVKLPHDARRDNLETLLEFTGESISPQPSGTVDYTRTVVFTVTAEDGSTRPYSVVVSNFTSAKEITSFIFKASDNAGMGKDLTATIEDSIISAVLPADADITQLKPSITFKGESISPANAMVKDFTNGATYTVTADDGTTRNYTIFVTNNNLVYIGSGNGNVYAISCANGKVKWKYNTGYQASHPIYKDGIVYVGSSDGNFYALDGSTGALKWKFFNLKTNFTAPHVVDGTVYVGFYTNNFQGGIYAINAQTGSLKWRSVFPGVGGGVSSGPTYADGLVYVSVFDGGLYAMDATTGITKWHYDAGITLSNPAVANGLVYISSEKAAFSAFDAKTGALKWTYDQSLNTKNAPTVLNGIVYEAGDGLYALNANNGSLIWKTPGSEVVTGGPNNTYINVGSLSSPVISGGLIFAGNYECNMFAFDLATGMVKWGTPKSWLPGPVVANGMLITDRGDNMLTAIHASTGKLIWTFTADAAINTYPCIVDSKGNAFYCGASGNVN